MRPLDSRLEYCGCGPRHQIGVNAGIRMSECAACALRNRGWWEKQCEDGRIAYKQAVECPQGYSPAEWVPGLWDELRQWEAGWLEESSGKIRAVSDEELYMRRYMQQ